MGTGAGYFVGAKTDTEQDHGAAEVKHVVRAVDGQDVGGRVQNEQTDDTEQQVGRSDHDVDRLGRANAGQTGDEQGGTNQKVSHIVEHVDLEDAEQQATLGGEKADAGGSREAKQADEKVDRAEDSCQQAVGGL